MNSLSWLIYLADVSSNLRDAAGLGLFIVFLITIITVIGSGAMPSLDNKKPSKLSVIVYATMVSFFTAAFSMILVLTPSKTTIYMIAASEAGEAVATSPEAKEMLNDLQEIIRRELKGKLGEVRI